MPHLKRKDTKIAEGKSRSSKKPEGGNFVDGGSTVTQTETAKYNSQENGRSERVVAERINGLFFPKHKIS